jgi:hypothetical protein
MAIAPCSRQSSAITSSSGREKTLPVGLCGVLTTIARVRALNARRSSSGSNVQSGGRSATKRGTAPLITQSGP